MNYSIPKGLIVSCQAEENEPLHGSEIMTKMAIAAEEGGAIAIRALSPKDVESINSSVNLPIIGITKDRESNFKAFITNRKNDIDNLVKAGAKIIAIDSTRRSRPEPLEELFMHIRNKYPKIKIMADISDIDDVKNILKLEPDYISTTLSGYTEYTYDREKPDLKLIDEIKEITNIPVIAEGNYTYPDQVRKAFLKGVHAVVVGGAITRPQQITKRFFSSIKDLLDTNSNSIGVDIGGTNTRFIKMNKNGEVISKSTISTPSNSEAIIKILKEKIKKIIDNNTHSIGIATAGRVNESGKIIFASENLPGWSGVHLKKIIEEEFGIKTVVNNDANFAAYAHYKKYNQDSVTIITFGTGLGSGIIDNGKILNGNNGNAGEIGHIKYPENEKKCNCGKKGCLETILSGKNLYERLQRESKDSVLKDYSKKIAWLIDLIKNVVGSEKIYLGGILPLYKEELLNLIYEEYLKITNDKVVDFIHYSPMGDLAGAMGAAYYAFDIWEEKI